MSAASRSRSQPPHPPQAKLAGVGFGLRWEFLDELVTAVEDGTLPPVPFFEVSPENYLRRGGYIPTALERVAEHVPLIAHGLMMSLGGVDPFEDAFFGELRRFLRRFAAPWHSDHLCFSGVDGRVFHDLLPMPQTRASARHVAARVREARDRLELPFAIENISFYTHLGEPEMEETEFISSILDAADCGLLLDVNNVFVNSQNHGFDPRAWIERMDLNRVTQIHVAGHEYREADGLIIDTHGSKTSDPVFELLAWTIARTGPVPVILERDNDVPPLADMLAEWREVDAAYQRGLATWQQAAPRADDGAASPAPSNTERLVAAQHVIAHAVRAPDEDAIAHALAAGYPELALSEADIGALRREDPRRIRVYRKLVRANLHEAIKNQLPLTHARLGGSRYEHYVARFCEEELPRSAILRDVAYEFARWASPLFAADAALPAYLADLARYELLEFDVYTAERLPPRLLADELVADEPVVFDSTARLGAFDYAVHHLPEALDASPEPQRLGVFAYRDAEGSYRELELTRLATAIVGRLLLGASFAESVREACSAEGVQLDAGVIDGTSKVMSDLADRGVVLGAGESAATSSPHRRWLMGPSFVAFSPHS